MEITINLGSHSYPLMMGSGSAAQLPAKLKSMFPTSRFALVTNTKLASIYCELLERWKKELHLIVHIIPDGEKYKTVKTWESILDFLLGAKTERSGIVIAFGGGVVGDITGFAASACLRGIGYIQVPTTLLAMVDSSVGGKTAVDHPMGKNLIGAFYQPKLVFIDTDFLNTLSQRDFLSGYAELFKNAFIGGREMFDFIMENSEAMLSKESDKLFEGISLSIGVKAKVVEQDEFETSGLRALLNFGHTFAHSLERYYNFESVLHGEAVFWGMACACELGIATGVISASDIPDYRALLSRMPLPELPSRPDLEQIFSGMFTDKKVVSGKLSLVIPSEPGRSLLLKNTTEEDVRKTLEIIFK